MPPPPPKRKLIHLLDQDHELPILADDPRGNVHEPEAKTQEQAEEEDFMSDIYLRPDSHEERGATKRHRTGTAPAPSEARRTASIKDEETQRLLGLSRNLMDDYQEEKEAQHTQEKNKAMRMMMLMGYRPGKALGLQHDDAEEGGLSKGQREAGHDEEEGLTRHASSTAGDEPVRPEVDSSRKSTSTTTATSQLLEPLLPNTSRLGSSVYARRGIGSTLPSPSLSRLISLAAQSHASEEARQRELGVELEEHRYRQRATLQAKEVHQTKLLGRARKTVWELDMRAAAAAADGGEKQVNLEQVDGAYSPLWLNERWFNVNKENLAPEIAALVDRAMGEELIREKGKDEEPSPASDPLPLPTTSAITRREQTRQFFSLPTSTRLAITLDYLRTQHSYCLFCGVEYRSREEMQETCPGEEEDLHD